MRIVLFSSSSYSIPIMRKLIAKRWLVHVVSVPSQKQGRGLLFESNIVKQFALKNNLSCSEPASLKGSDVVDRLSAFHADFFVIASYGKIIPASIFSLPKHAALNVHPSLLPKYRGASPIQAALLHGDHETGVSVAQITARLDAGDIFIQENAGIFENENMGNLLERLSETSANLLMKVLEDFKTYDQNKIPQNESKSSYAGKIKKDDGLVSWKLTAREIHNRVRAFTPWPSVFFFFKGKRIKIMDTFVEDRDKDVPGSIVSIDSEFIKIQTARGIIGIKTFQPEAKKDMSARDFINGYRLKLGDKLADD